MNNHIVGNVYFVISEPYQLNGKVLTKHERTQLRSELQDAEVFKKRFKSRKDAENVLIGTALNKDIFSVCEMADLNIF